MREPPKQMVHRLPVRRDSVESDGRVSMSVQRSTHESDESTKVVRLNPNASSRDGGTREAILVAALNDFARFGFDGTAMATVARSAGITQPLMHYYFASKDELWRAAVARAYDELLVQHELNRDLEEVDTLSAIRLLVRRFIMFHTRHPNLGPLAASETQFMTARLIWLSDTYLAPLERHLCELLHRGRDEGLIRDDLPTPYMARFIIGGAGLIFTSGALMKRIYDIDTADSEAVEQHTEVAFELLFNGLLPQS